MGVRGTSLYSGDFAADLRSTIAAVVRLPFDPDRLIGILCETEPSAANDPNDEDHTTFWLIAADQFAKRGIVCDRVRNHALHIIDARLDLAMLEKLGMKPADLRKRSRMLDELRTRIATPPLNPKLRITLQKPQPLLFEIGDVLVYPTCRGASINPYFASKEMLNVPTSGAGFTPWTQDGWGAMVIFDRGRAFDFLSWYRALTIAEARSEKPSLDSLRGSVLWRLGRPGTCSANHFKKLELEKIGRLPIDGEKLNLFFPDLKPGISAAVSDISISNSMSSAPYVRKEMIAEPGTARRGLAPTMLGIGQILREQA